MTPYYADPWLTVYHGDATAVLSTLPAESVHCVVSSPPYWGLRDYGTASWSGGDADCDHLTPAGGTRNNGRDRAASGGTFHDSPRTDAALHVPYRDRCGKCGAMREDGQLGLEATPEAYVAAMVAVFREVRRVLRKDGTVWLNLGDSYVGAPVGSFNGGGFTDKSAQTGGRDLSGVATSGILDKTKATGLKPKDLVGIPWRVAFALQADGWYLRSDIVWSKPNPMPESVTDRPTKAHEMVFLLSRSPRYFYDSDAVREPHTASHLQQHLSPVKDRGDQRQLPKQGYHDFLNPAGRNLRSVWTIATAPYPGAHFATFPPALVEPCIKAGTSERGVCPECGAPWQRIVAVDYDAKGRTTNGPRSVDNRDITAGFAQRLEKRTETTGWRPSCGHDGEPVPATVLDMFAGSGTVGLVAQRLSRRAVLIDLSMDYLGQLMERNRDIPLGLGA